MVEQVYFRPSCVIRTLSAPFRWASKAPVLPMMASRLYVAGEDLIARANASGDPASFDQFEGLELSWFRTYF